MKQTGRRARLRNLVALLVSASLKTGRMGLTIGAGDDSIDLSWLLSKAASTIEKECAL